MLGREGQGAGLFPRGTEEAIINFQLVEKRPRDIRRPDLAALIRTPFRGRCVSLALNTGQLVTESHRNPQSKSHILGRPLISKVALANTASSSLRLAECSILTGSLHNHRVKAKRCPVY